MKFSEHLSKLLHDRKITQVELANYLGVTRQAIARWLNGESEPVREQIIAIASFLQLPPAYVMFGPNGAFSMADIDKGVLGIPIIDQQSATESLEASPSTHSIPIEKIWIQSRVKTENFNRLRAIKIDSSNMRPTISRGDIAIVDTSVKGYTYDGIYLVIMHDQVLIKRISKQPHGCYTLINDDRYYPPMTIRNDQTNDLKIIGQCLMIFNVQEL